MQFKNIRTRNSQVCYFKKVLKILQLTNDTLARTTLKRKKQRKEALVSFVAKTRFSLSNN